MKAYRLSSYDMYGAVRAGKRVSEDARLAGCTPSVVRYRIKQISEPEFLALVRLRRVCVQKGHPSPAKSATRSRIHDYAIHTIIPASQCPFCHVGLSGRSTSSSTI